MTLARPTSEVQNSRSVAIPPSPRATADHNSHDHGVRFSVADAAVYLFVILMGAFQLAHYPHFPDFFNDVTYPDLARSILQHGSYQMRLMPETTFPPGFPLILAAVGFFAGLGPAAMFSVVAVSTTLAILAVYEFLRRIEGRGIAAVSSLILASSPAMFSFNTAIVYPEMTYILVSFLALLLAIAIDRTSRRRYLIGLVTLLSFALASAVLIRSVGVALLAALFTWIAVSLVFVPDAGRRRLLRFIVPLAVGAVAQLSWSMWAGHHKVLEWQLPGYPRSYISQVSVKDGNHPELGVAHLGDIPIRVARNEARRAAGLSQFLTLRYITAFWSSPAIICPLVLIAIGLVFSLRAGGALHDWYYLWYEIIFMLWPWNYADRFLIPVVPLACLYLWRGIKVVASASAFHPKRAGAVFTGIGAVLCIASAAYAFGIARIAVNPERVRGDHLQEIAATLFWAAVAASGCAMLRIDSVRRVLRSPGGFARFGHAAAVRTVPATRLVAILAVAAVVVSGTIQVLARGRDNLHPRIAATYLPMLRGAEWIRTNEPSGSVLMASEPEFVFHFAHDPVVWFPPISSASTLMDGIRAHHVDVVLVTHQPHSYWLPPEDVCFQALLQSYGRSFRLRDQGADYWVYDVVPPTVIETQPPGSQ